MAIQRVFASVLTDQLQASRDFWVAFLGFTVTFDSNWFVQLAAPGDSALEVGLVLREHETIPQGFRGYPQGVLLTVVVDDVDALFARARRLGIDVIEPPTDMFYGMRRMLVVDPNELLIDLSSPLDREPTAVEV